MTQGFWKRVGSMFGKNGDSQDVSTLAPAKERTYTSRDGLQRLGTLLDSMQTHFDNQDRRAEELTESVDRVASMLEQMNDSQRQQTEYIRELAARSENANAAGLNEALNRMPASLDSQSEAVRALAHQIEISQESDHRVAHSLHQLGSAVDRMRNTSDSQMDVLQRLQTREDEQRDNLKDLLKEQNRRFVIIISVTAVLVLGALGALATALFMVMRNGG